MGNEIKEKTWLLDSAGSVTQRKIKLYRIDWYANTADADDLSIVEANGASSDNIVIGKAYHTNDFLQWYFDGDQIYNGMSVAVIDAGKVLVTIREIL